MKYAPMKHQGTAKIELGLITQNQKTNILGLTKRSIYLYKISAKYFVCIIQFYISCERCMLRHEKSVTCCIYVLNCEISYLAYGSYQYL